MPSLKTECTELSVGFGLLYLAPMALTQSEIESCFDTTLEFEKYADFKQEFAVREDYYRKFYAIGLSLCNSYAPFANITSIRWEGPNQQAQSVSMSIDILAANTPISVKANSNVVFNLSPHKLFVSLPQGILSPSKAENWYLKISPEFYQRLYSYVRDRHCEGSLPKNIFDYHQTIKAKQRKKFAKIIKEFSDAEDNEFTELYREFCHDVAQKSAKLFNDALATSLASSIRNSIIENIVRDFFRIDNIEYILCGLDKGKEFAVVIPNLTSWKRNWKFKRLEAMPDLTCGQSVVKFKLTLENKTDHKEYHFSYRSEIRWSHGKFCGNPEAKVYKEFTWTDVPFFQKIYHLHPVHKYKIIGSGGFGTVYEGVLKSTGQKVAIKELDDRGLNSDERRRFEREVRLQSELEHKNILPVIESDLSANIPWFATALANCNLEEIAEDLRGNYQRIDRIFYQILGGIRFAHYHDTIHRDLKPENILLFDDDQVRIGDFGLGKNLNEATFTQTSDGFLGSLYYAAPEQVEGFSKVDPRADIYALGKTLMHMVVGEIPPPFYSEIDFESLEPRYRYLIQRCTLRNPDERFQTVDEVIRAFQEVTGFQESAQLRLPL